MSNQKNRIDTVGKILLSYIQTKGKYSRSKRDLGDYNFLVYQIKWRTEQDEKDNDTKLKRQELDYKTHNEPN